MYLTVLFTNKMMHFNMSLSHLSNTISVIFTTRMNFPFVSKGKCFVFKKRLQKEKKSSKETLSASFKNILLIVMVLFFNIIIHIQRENIHGE